MIYTDNQLKQKIVQMIDDFESEVVEFKEAKSNYSFNDIGKYFSALSNEANIRGLNEAWLVFGVTNDKRIVGTEFRKQGGLQNLKKELVNGTNERLTFMEIYELTMEKCRIVLFQIPPAIRGIPTTWQGAAYAREHESISPLPMNKVDLIRSQIGMDWSKEIVDGASIEDLNPEAIKKARKLFSKRQSDRKKAQEILSKLSDVEVLNKAGITIKGKITRTALLLLGNSESSYYFDGFIPRITWTLYNADNTVKAYEHFDMPMLLAVDKVYSRIRNVKYRYIAGQQTLFPDEVNQYEPELIKEIINIGLVVAWEAGDLYKRNYYIESLLLEENVSLRSYHGVTHRLRDFSTGEYVSELILLKDLILYLCDYEQCIILQEKYDED